MKKSIRVRREGRANDRVYSAEHLQLLVRIAEISALQGTKRMNIREINFSSTK